MIGGFFLFIGELLFHKCSNGIAEFISTEYCSAFRHRFACKQPCLNGFFYGCIYPCGKIRLHTAVTKQQRHRIQDAVRVDKPSPRKLLSFWMVKLVRRINSAFSLAIFKIV